MDKKKSNRNRIFGAIGVLWGGSMLVSKLLGGGAQNTNGAYAAGQSTALVFGAIMLLVGGYYLIKG
ncbi:MAG: hypothetical protein ABJA67_04880 [Chthonomonadales bacterium]